MMMPGREYQAQPSRFGFNGKENDNDVKGFGNQLEYGMRVYDGRLGRFLSFDPLSKEYNDLSPYHYAGNNPIQNLDVDGGEPLDYMQNWQYRRFSVNGGKMIYSRNIRDPQLGIMDVEAVYDNWTKKTWFIHQSNDGRNYYWKHNPGEDQTIRIAGNGKWVEFKTQNRIQYEYTVKLTRGIATFFAGAAAAPFAYAGIAEAGSLAWGSLENYIINAVARAAYTYYRWAPTIGAAGTLMAEFLDESGSVGASNASRFAKLGLDEQLVVKTLVESGRKVEILEASKVEKIADFLVDGIKTELKTLTGSTFNVNTAISKLKEGFKQGSNVILNLRAYDLDSKQVGEIIERTKGALGGSLPGTVEVWTQSGIYKF